MRALHEINPIVTPTNGKSEKFLQESLHSPTWWERWFVPHEETQMVSNLQSKGLFIPWPLLAIIVTLAILLVSGVVTLQVQISNLSTTLLLRDADHARQVGDLKTTMAEIKGKNEQLQVYIGNDREKLVAIETKLGIRRN